jgi:signal transduction histidine kinase
MGPEAAASAFEPYYSTKETGVGLGLAVVRRIVEGHGGTIDLDTARGRGTTVRVRLPLRPAATGAAEVTAATAGSRA